MKRFAFFYSLASIIFLLANIPTIANAAEAKEGEGEDTIASQLAKLEARVNSIEKDMSKAGGAGAAAASKKVDERGKKSAGSDDLTTGDTKEDKADTGEDLATSETGGSAEDEINKRLKGHGTLDKHRAITSKNAMDKLSNTLVTSHIVTPHIKQEVCKNDEGCIAIATDVLRSFVNKKGLKDGLTLFATSAKDKSDFIKTQDFNRVIRDFGDETTAHSYDFTVLNRPWTVSVKNLPSKSFSKELLKKSQRSVKLDQIRVGKLYDISWDGAQLKADFTSDHSHTVSIHVVAGAAEDAPDE